MHVRFPHHWFAVISRTDWLYFRFVFSRPVIKTFLSFTAKVSLEPWGTNMKRINICSNNHLNAAMNHLLSSAKASDRFLQAAGKLFVWVWHL